MQIKTNECHHPYLMLGMLLSSSCSCFCPLSESLNFNGKFFFFMQNPISSIEHRLPLFDFLHAIFLPSKFSIIILNYLTIPSNGSLIILSLFMCFAVDFSVSSFAMFIPFLYDSMRWQWAHKRNKVNDNVVCCCCLCINICSFTRLAHKIKIINR